eukprot:g6546.t1
MSYNLAEVAKHNSKTDCWVVVDGQVLDVTSFLSEHPGGELAIITFAGKDATEEFNMNLGHHRASTVAKHNSKSDCWVVVDGQVLNCTQFLSEHPGSVSGKNWSKSEKNREVRMKGEGKVSGWIGAIMYMVLGFLKEVLFTIFPQKNVNFSSDRVGLTRSAMFLFVFIIIHAVGNLHVFLGPDDFNGYGYFYVRLYWTGFGLQANIVEEYILLAALLHVVVAIKRTWDISVNYALNSGKMNLAISGVTLLTFMMIHLYQFRFGATQPWTLCPPPYLLNLKTLLALRLNLFWVDDPGCKEVAVRDIYRMEFEVFQSLGWVLFYLAAVIIFSTHMCLGWQKVVPAPALEIPKKYHSRATHMGYIFTIFIAVVYASFPFYCHIFSMSSGSLSKEPATP